MFPKHKRIKDNKVIQECRLEYCEYCGSPAYGEPHHIVTRGSGGADIKENLIQLSCNNSCHDKAHRGLITKDVLFSIVSRREGISVDECKRRINKAKGHGVM